MGILKETNHCRAGGSVVLHWRFGNEEFSGVEGEWGYSSKSPTSSSFIYAHFRSIWPSIESQ